MPAAVYSASELADRLGCSDWLVFKMVREGSCPVPFIRLGAKRVVFPKAPADKILGLASDESEAT